MSRLYLISDLQTGSYKTGLLRAKWIDRIKNIEIIDITHDIRLNNIIEAAFVSKHIHYPENLNTITHFKVGSCNDWIVYQHSMNLFVLPNNGLIGMLFQDIDYNRVWLTEDGNEIDYTIKLLKGEIKQPMPAGNKLVIRYARLANISNDTIVAECIFTDGHGNCYFNLSENELKQFLNGRNFSIRIQHYTGHYFREIGRTLSDSDPGEALFRFSKEGFLKLQINLGSAKQLFRIKEETKIIIDAT